MGKRMQILIVEDEPDLCEAMASFLILDGYSAHGVGSATAGAAWLRGNAVDIVILDVGLPDADGIAWLKDNPVMRGKGLIVTTARGELDDRLRGHAIGADAYLVKPVEFAELRLVVRNIARRLTPVRPAGSADWRLDTVTWTLAAGNGKTVRLSHSEAVLLNALAASPGETVVRNALIRALGQSPAIYDPRRMEIMVRRLRNKVKTETGDDLPLTTVHGLGYAFTAAILMSDAPAV
ncbi:MAG: response regulator transcription factor [Sulfuricella sp.]|nr:response regulator transcription factor [Sulfuricella sp.]